MTEHPHLTLLDHAVAHDALAELRDAGTTPARFAARAHQLGLLVAAEATRTLPTTPVEVTTPLETMEGARLAGPAPVIVPILRAGLGMVEAVRSLVPEAVVGHVGLERDHDTLEPREYYVKMPDRLDERVCLVVDPMLATGGSAAATLDLLWRRGARSIRFLCLVAAPEGVARLTRAHPHVTIFAGALDRELNDLGYILPGLGDAGDRLFGTEVSEGLNPAG
jgi:uracil phosphoribosyltransferase